MNDNLKTPPKKLLLIVFLGGIATALVMIAALEFLSGYLSKKTFTTTEKKDPTVPTEKPVDPAEIARQKQAEKIAILDNRSLELPGERVSPKTLRAVKTPYFKAKLEKFNAEEELAIAQRAWGYFQKNWHEETGLVNSVDNFVSVTLWDQTAALAALVSAYELKIISASEFKAKMSLSLKTLAELPLYKDELPNKVYNPQTLIPVNYGQVDRREEIGWSAIDLGRLALWLKIIAAKYPEYKQDTQAVWKSWDVTRLTKDGNMYGTSIVKGKEQYNQEGRLGYENYAALGLKLWGLKVDKALDYEKKAVFVNLYQVGIPYDVRDYHNSEANNYVLSEPYFLDGMETGFQALPKPYADRILAAQEARYQKTKLLTALTEDNLDRPPYFVYNTLFVNGKPWSTITDTRENHDRLRFLSTKAAIGWHSLYNTDYTSKLYQFVQGNLNSDDGWYNGFYEYWQEPNKSLTANNNGIILECMLYLKVGKPLTMWAGVKVPR